MPTKDIISRNLHELSKLVFSYANEGGVTVERKLGFLENTTVTESRKNKFTRYTPLGNNGDFFVFMGSESREFKLQFNLTLPHIMQYIIVKDAPSKSPIEVTKESYLLGGKQKTLINDSRTNINALIKSFDDSFFQRLNTAETFIENNQQNSVDNIVLNELYTNTGDRRRALYQVMYCINLIRTSVMTHSKKSYLGPPVVRLSHGMLYDNIPCVVTSYGISHDESAGYDRDTLLPNVIKVKMDLSEVRLRGRNFNPKTDGDFVPGWDSIINDSFSTIDPTARTN